MTNHKNISITVSIMMFACVFVMVFFSFDASADVSKCAMQTTGSGGEHVSPSYTIVTCMTGILDNVVEDLLLGIITGVGQAVGLVCAFAVIILGIRVAFGQVKSMQEVIVFIVKLTLVGVVSLNIDMILEYRNIVVQVSDRLGAIMLEGYKDGGSCLAVGEGIGIFQALDCVILQTFGQISGGDAAIGAMGIAVLLVGTLFFGPGLIILILTISLILTVIAAVVEVLYMYLSALVSITILVTLTPIMVVFIFFEKTKRMTNDWFQMLLVYSIQPPLIIAALVITLSVMNVFSTKVGALWDEVRQEMEMEDEGQPIGTLFTFSSDIIPEETAQKFRKEAEQTALDKALSVLSYVNDQLLDVYTGRVLVKLGKEAGAALANKIAEEIKVSRISLKAELLWKIILTLFSQIILLMFLFGFIKSLPSIIDQLAAKGNIIGIDRGKFNSHDKVSQTTQAMVDYDNNRLARR